MKTPTGRLVLLSSALGGALLGYLALRLLAGPRLDAPDQCMRDADGNVTSCTAMHPGLPRSIWMDLTISAAGAGLLLAIALILITRGAHRLPAGRPSGSTGHAYALGLAASAGLFVGLLVMDQRDSACRKYMDADGCGSIGWVSIAWGAAVLLAVLGVWLVSSLIAQGSESKALSERMAHT